MSGLPCASVESRGEACGSGQTGVVSSGPILQVLVGYSDHITFDIVLFVLLSSTAFLS
jgi:hypothetical protein